MVISIKTADEIEKMRTAGRLAAEVLTFITPYVVPGVTTEQLDKQCHDYITIVQQATPACLGYKGFPKSVCISVNEVVCHGVPDQRILKNGDIVNIDVTVIANGYHGDTSQMFLLGEPTIRAKFLCRTTQESLYEAIRIVQPGMRLKKIGQTIESFAKSRGFSVVREYCGHGIGKKFHEQPDVFHFAAEDRGVCLLPGMTFTIEPMLNAGSAAIKILPDGWTARTKDRGLSAQYEHTILVTDTGCDILTLRSDECLHAIFNQ